MRISQTCLVILLVQCTLVALPAYAGSSEPASENVPLPAEDQKRIRDLASESAAASAKNDWQAAREALLRAWAIKPLPMLAANLGYVEIKQGLYREAAEHLNFFLDHAPADHPERRADAEQQYAECHKRIASVSVKVDIDGAQVEMDSAVLGASPLEEQLFVEPGTHSFRVTRLGYQPQERTISIDADRDEQLQFSLRPASVFLPESPPAFQATPVQSSLPEERGIQPRTWALIGGSAATVVGLGFGIGYAIRAHSLNTDAEAILAQIDNLPDTTASQKASNAQCHERTGTAQVLCGQFWSTSNKQTDATNISNVAFITAGVFGVATVATYFLWPRKSSNAEQRPQAWLRVAPWSDPRSSGLSIVGGF